MGKLFTSASVGAIVAALAFLTTFMPYIIILSLEAVMTSGLKMVVVSRKKCNKYFTIL